MDLHCRPGLGLRPIGRPVVLSASTVNLAPASRQYTIYRTVQVSRRNDGVDGLVFICPSRVVREYILGDGYHSVSGRHKNVV